MIFPRMFLIPFVFINISFFIIGSLTVIFFGIPILYNAKASESWPTTEGIIKTSEVIQKNGDNGVMHSANVIYNYTVKNKNMDGNKIWFGGDYSSSNREKFQRTVNEYPVGKKVKVYYNPDDTVVAVLLPGIYPSTLIIFAAGCLFAGIGGIVLFLLFYFGKDIKGEPANPLMKQSYDGASLENTYGSESSS